MPNYNLAFPYTTTNLILYLLTSQPMIEKSNSKSRCMWKLNVWNKLINPIQEKKCIFSNSWNLGYVSTFKEVKKPWWCSSMEQQWMGWNFWRSIIIFMPLCFDEKYLQSFQIFLTPLWGKEWDLCSEKCNWFSLEFSLRVLLPEKKSAFTTIALLSAHF